MQMYSGSVAQKSSVGHLHLVSDLFHVLEDAVCVSSGPHSTVNSASVFTAAHTLTSSLPLERVYGHSKGTT